MADTESIRQAVESPAPFSTWLGVVLLFSLFGAIVFAVVGPAPRGDTYEQTRARKRLEKLKTLREGDAKQLTTYSWIDKTKGVVGLPIDRAMTLTVAELGAKKPAAAYPIATPVPEASAIPAGPATASPAPAPSPTPSGTPKPTSVAGPSSESRGQPAAAVVPPSAPPGTQPGPSPPPAASPAKPKPAPSPEKN
jgi:hypothetical protein